MNSSPKYGMSHKAILFITACLVLVSVGSYYLGRYVEKDNYRDFLKSFRNIRENSDKYSYVNPLVGTFSSPATDIGLFSDSKDEVDSYLRDEHAKGNLYDHSFYFRDLNTGLWFGSNETVDFFPASLFKLPVAIAVYKQSEDDPSFLKKSALYTKELDDLNIKTKTNSESNLIVGKAYSVENLVSIMLTKSDNGAKNLLLSVMQKSYLNQLFLVVSQVDLESTDIYKISSSKYALFLRVLYGSSYVNEEHSELILSLLSKSTFVSGLVEGLPRNIPVAHKYGVYEFEENINGTIGQGKQLHDCGVVYSADKPYIFCMMTKGKDSEDLMKIIAHVSELVYNNHVYDEDK